MSDPSVEEDDVRHMASLAHVELDEDELARFADQFAEILSWFEMLDTVPDVDEAVDVENVLRSDTVEASLTQDEALSNASDAEDGYFRGPPVG